MDRVQEAKLIDDRAHVGPVFGRGSHHGGTADVDQLDGGVGAERVQVAHHQTDGLDALPVQVGEVGGCGPVGQDASVEPGVEGLDPPTEQLGRPGDGLDRGVRDAGRFQGGGRAAAGDELMAQLGQAAGEVLQTGLVVDG